MTREQKAQYIDDLAQELSQSNIFYLADTSEMTVDVINKLRRRCFNSNIKLRSVKNALLAKAFEKVDGKDFSELNSVLHGQTSIMFTEVGNLPAKIIKEFREKSQKPVLKAAYVEEAIFIGDNQLDALVAIKSKEELLGEIVGLLQSPAKNVISALKGQGGKIAGILKTLEERA
jgi:large subunit ribosomal protein L10